LAQAALSTGIRSDGRGHASWVDGALAKASMSTSPTLCGDTHHSLPAAEVQFDFESEVPSTPRNRVAVRWRGSSPSSPGADDSGSPERTPGPGEGSPVTMPAQSEEPEDGDEPSCEMASVLAEAEERSSRRAAAIRGVLEQLRGARVDSAKLCEETEDEPLPQPRAHPLPIPVPMPFSGGLTRERSPGASANRTLQSNATLAHRSHPCTTTVCPLEERRLLKHCGALEERLEQHQSVLDRTMGSLESEQHAAHEAHESLLKAEAEIAYTEGIAARKEAELRNEMINMRAEYQRDRERLRSEGRRLQTSMKDIQARSKAEVQARTEALEQVDSLKEQLSAMRGDLQRRGREGQEARSAFAGLERRLEQHAELFKWITTRCNEVIGEDVQEIIHKEGGLASELNCDSLKRILSRTFTLLERRANNDSDYDKENMCKGNAMRAAAQSKSKKASEVAQRLAVVQQELLNTEVEHEEMISRHRTAQARYSETEEALQAASSRLASNPAIRTEQRSRLRAAEEGQKRLQKQLAQAEDERQWQYTRHEEEHERTRSRVSALQRAKEAAERYIATEEDAWINAQREERALQAEYSRLRSEIQDAEANAREASSDAVEARAASQLATVTTRRLEADLEEMQKHRLAPETKMARACVCGGALAPQTQLEAEVIERLRTEMSTLREETWSRLQQNRAELEQEQELHRQKTRMEENNFVQWRRAAEKAGRDCEDLRKALEEQNDISQRVKFELEQQQDQQARIDEAKRMMVNSAMEEQEQRLRNEIAYVEAAAQSSYEEAVRQLQRCADEHQEQTLQLDYANKSIAFFQQREATFEAELQQQFQDLSQQEKQICDFGRAELMAMTEDQEARMEEASRAQTEHRIVAAVTSAEKRYKDELAHVEEVSRAQTECRIAEAVALAERRYKDELAHLRGCHGAAIAAVHGEYAGEVEALRRLELTSRDELTHARLACEATEADAEETSRVEIEKARAAQRALKDEKRTLSTKIRDELREQMLGDLWVESCTKVRQEILEDVRKNPCSQLRKELSRDLRHELADQVRAELRSELHSEIFSSSSSGVENVSPASTVRRRRRQRPQSATACSTSASGNGFGASPSSIGACSPGKSSPECASSMILFNGSSSPCRWPETGEHTSRNLGTSAVFASDSESKWQSPFEKTSHARKPNGVSSAPASRQSSGPALDFIETIPPTGTFRQWTAPPSNTNWKLDGMLPPAPCIPEVITYATLPPPPTPSNEGVRSLSHQLGLPSEIGALRATALPQPPAHQPKSSFEEQASAVLAMVSRSRAPFRTQGFPPQGKEPEQSLGSLPPQPGVS